MSAANDHARVLLDKANNDLIAAHATLPTGQAFDTVCFHAQQAVEKALKAVLAWHDIDYPWTHDLRELVAIVKPILPLLSNYERRIIALIPFAVIIRYSGLDEPSREETETSLTLAVEVCHLIQSHIADR